jgi:hypothetical protein
MTFELGQQVYSVDFQTFCTVVAINSAGFVVDVPQVGPVEYPHTADPEAFVLVLA